MKLPIVLLLLKVALVLRIVRPSTLLFVSFILKRHLILERWLSILFTMLLLNSRFKRVLVIIRSLFRPVRSQMLVIVVFILTAGPLSSSDSQWSISLILFRSSVSAAN